jgi:hypothetical protein
MSGILIPMNSPPWSGLPAVDDLAGRYDMGVMASAQLILDQSGRGRHLQLGEEGTPDAQDPAMDGVRATFSGGQQCYAVKACGETALRYGTWTLMLVARFSGSSGHVAGLAYSATYWNGLKYTGTAGQLKLWSLSYTEDHTSPAALAVPTESYIVAMVRSAGGEVLARRMDDSSEVTVARAAGDYSATVSLGRQLRFYGQFADSLYVQSVIVWAKALSDAEAARADAYLRLQAAIRGVTVL